MPVFPSGEWIREFIDEVNRSEEYAAYSATWEGDVVLVVGAEPDRGVPQDVFILLDLHRGACRGGGLCDSERGDEAEFLVSAPYSRWKEVILGELEPVKGLMQGKLKVRGDLQKILRYVKATQELARLTRNVETTFLDER